MMAISRTQKKVIDEGIRLINRVTGSDLPLVDDMPSMVGAALEKMAPRQVGNLVEHVIGKVISSEFTAKDLTGAVQQSGIIEYAVELGKAEIKRQTGIDVDKTVRDFKDLVTTARNLCEDPGSVIGSALDQGIHWMMDQFASFGNDVIAQYLPSVISEVNRITGLNLPPVDNLTDLANAVLNHLGEAAAVVNTMTSCLQSAINFVVAAADARVKEAESKGQRPSTADRQAGYARNTAGSVCGGCCGCSGKGCADGMKSSMSPVNDGSLGEAGNSIASDAVDAGKSNMGEAAQAASEAAANEGAPSATAEGTTGAEAGTEAGAQAGEEAGTEAGEEAGGGEEQDKGEDDMAPCRNTPGAARPAIEWGEMAMHNVLLGDLVMYLYNNHRHTKVKKGDDISGPPQDSDKIKCSDHLSHVVYVIRDPWDQPPSPLQQKMVDVGNKVLEAVGEQSATPSQPSQPPAEESQPPSQPAEGSQPSSTEPSAPAEEPQAKDIVETGKKILDGMADFCKDPVGCIVNKAKEAGVPGLIVDAAANLISGVGGQVLDAVKNIAGRFGIEIPDVSTVCGIVSDLAEGDIVGAAASAMKTIAPMALAAVGIPPEVTNAALDIAESVLDSGGDVGSMLNAVADATGAEGLASIAGAAYSAVISGGLGK